MRQYAVLRNVVRDVNFGVVVKSEGTMKFFGWSEKAVEWANWANANNADLNQLPPNISIGEFKGMSDEMMKNIILSSEEATAAGSSTIKTKTLSFNVGGERHQHSSKFPSFVDSPIASDWMAKKKSINFKALNFKKEVALNEISLGMRSHELAFNNETKQFVAKPNKITATYSRSKIQKKISRSAERKFGKQIIEYANKEILKNFVAPTIKRDSMGKFTKEILDVYTKAKLGRAIGRAVGSAARGITPNRRTRGVASRFISGVLDPGKRRDIDGDGMIFDGTWREMPDPNRFANVPQKPDSRRGADRTLRSSGQRRPMSQEDGVRLMRGEYNSAQEELDQLNTLIEADARAPIGSQSMTNEIARSYQARREMMQKRKRYLENLIRRGGVYERNKGPGLKPEKDPLEEFEERIRRDLREGKIPKLRSRGGRRERVDMTDMTPEEREANRPSNVSEEEYRRRTLRDADRMIDEGGLRSSGSTAEEQDDAGRYDDMPSIESAVTKLTAGDRMSVDELDYLDEVVNKILNNPDTPENVRDAMLDLKNSISKRRKGGDDSRGLRSSGKKPNNQQSRARDIARADAIDALDDVDAGGGDWDSPFRRAWMKLKIGMRPGTADRFSKASRIMNLFNPKSTEGDRDKVFNDLGINPDGRIAENITGMIDAVKRGEMPSEQQLKAFVRDAVLMGGVIRGRDGKSIDKEVNNDFAGVVEAYIVHQNPNMAGGGDNRALRSSGRPAVPKEELLDMIRGGIDGRGAEKPMSTEDFLRIRKGEFNSAQEELDDINRQIEAGKRGGIGSQSLRLDDFYAEQDALEKRKKYLENLIKRGGDYDRDKGPSRKPEKYKPISLRMDDETSRAVQAELSRRGLSRSEQRVDTPLSTRRSLATTQRAASPRGTTLRSSSSGGDGKTRTPAERTASRGTGAGPGGKAGHNRMKTTYGKTKKGDDGKVFDSLTPEQQAAIKKEITETVKPALDKKLKTFFSKYWAARTQRGSKKQSLVAVRRRAKGDARGRYEKVSADTPLESDDIYEMLYRLDGQVADGLVEKFEVSDKDSRELKLDEDGNAKVSTVKNGYTNQQRTLDDAQTILNMIEADDFSALEHLHPSTKKKIADVIKKNGGQVPKGWIDSESSVAGWAGGEGRTKAPDAIDLEKERGIGKKKKDKRPPLFQRLRRVDPEREKRVELRAARRQGRVREGIALDPELELKRRKLRARAMKRTFMSRFRKNRDPEELSTDMKARKDEVSIVKTNPGDGTVEITDGFVDLLNALDQGLIGINEQKKGRKLTEQQIESEYQTLLRRLWENSGYSETPIQLKEDEVKALLDAGWQVMLRGTGGEKINSETYVEQFITSEGRFIPGQNGSAFGIGEYFAYPGRWDSYGGGPNDRHTIIALIPPSADVMTRSEIEREHRNLQNITTRIGTAFKVFGGRDATKAMTAEELVAEIDKAVPDLASDKSRTGQIVKQLRDRLEAVSKLPQNDEASRNAANDQKTKILNTLDYLERFTKQQAEMIAPLIGVDAIDTNNESEPPNDMEKPILLHNRTNVAVFQVPTTRDQAKAMVSDSNGQGRPKAWTKWKRKLADVKDRESVPTRRRRSRTGSAVKPQPAAPTPAAPTPAAPTPATPTPSAPNSQVTKAPVDVSSWTSSRPQSTGSNPATLLTAPDGTQYYTKLPKGTPDDRDRMETESLASELYKLAGIQSADVQMGTRNGQPVTLSRMVQSRMPNSQGDQDEALKGYVVDAWLANWDAPLNDNIKIDSNGNAVRLDVGGSLDFRAQGARKGQAWGNTVGEIDSMKKSGTYDYTRITDAAIKQQAKALGNVTDADIRATVSRIVSDPARAKALADTLIARRDDIVKRYGQ